MLTAIRGTLGSFVVLALMGLLIASFALWGIPDTFTGPGGRTVATIGDVEIGVTEFENVYTQRLRQIEAQIGQPLDRSQAAAMGLPQQVLQSLITERVYDIHARDIGLRASNRQVVKTLHEIEAFYGFDGRFDRQAYESQLQRAAITPASFEASLKSGIVRRQLIEALTAGHPAPDALARPLFRYRNEARKATIINIDTNLAGDVEQPTDEDIAATYEVEKERFMTPEYRQISLAEITPESIAKPEDVTEEQLENAYMERLAEFRIPELRSVDIVTFDINDTQSAARFIERVKDGEPFEVVLSDMTNFTMEEVELGDVSHMDLESDYNARVADAAFTTETGDLSMPAQSVFGWHIFRVNGITAPVDRPLEQVADSLRQEIASEMALDRVYDISIEAEEALARGASLREIASNLDLALVDTTITKEGLTEEGALAPQSIMSVLDEAWKLEVIEPVLLLPSDNGGFVLIDVLETIPPQQIPLAEVSDQIRDSLIHERKVAAAGMLAESLAEKIRAGDTMDVLAEERGADFIETDWVIRSRIDQGLQVAPVVGRLMFQMNKGEIAVERNASGNGYVIVRLDEEKPGDPDANIASFDGHSRDMAVAMLNDALQQYQASLRKDYKVDVNFALMQETANPEIQY